MRPTLYGPDGRTPIAFDAKEEEPRLLDKALLIEFFGTLMLFQQQHEWPKLPGGLNEGVGKMLDVIVDRVGPEAINLRYARYGIKIGLVPGASDEPAQMPDVPESYIQAEPHKTYIEKAALSPSPTNPYKDHNPDKVLTFPKADRPETGGSPPTAPRSGSTDRRGGK